MFKMPPEIADRIYGKLHSKSDRSSFKKTSTFFKDIGTQHDQVMTENLKGLSTQSLVKKCRESKKVAMFVLQNMPEKLGKFDINALFAICEKSHNGQSDMESNMFYNGVYLYTVACAFDEAKEYVLENLSSKLSPAYKNKLERIDSYWHKSMSYA